MQYIINFFHFFVFFCDTASEIFVFSYLPPFHPSTLLWLGPQAALRIFVAAIRISEKALTIGIKNDILINVN